MLDELLSPLRLPERALAAVSQIAEDLSGLRTELARGVGRLEKTTDSMAADLRPLRTDAAVMRESTSRLPEGVAKLEHVNEGVGTLHADMRELCTHIETIAKQLAAMEENITGLKGSVEDVTKDLPGAGGGPIARMREAIGGQSPP